MVGAANRRGADDLDARQHFLDVRLGLQVLIEDYVHDDALKFAAITLLNFYVVGGAVFGIFTVAKLAFTGAPA